MRKSVLLVAAFSTMTVLLGGCTSSLTGDTYSRDEARRVQTVRMGTIVALRPVQIEGTKTPIGAATGARRKVGRATRDGVDALQDFACGGRLRLDQFADVAHRSKDLVGADADTFHRLTGFARQGGPARHPLHDLLHAA